MNYVYPAVFYEEEGKISVLFPDLGNLRSEERRVGKECM